MQEEKKVSHCLENQSECRFKQRRADDPEVNIKDSHGADSAVSVSIKETKFEVSETHKSFQILDFDPVIKT